MFSFLVVDANPTVILERSEGSKSEMRVTVLFLPALILRSAKASLKNDSGVGAVQKNDLARSRVPSGTFSFATEAACHKIALDKKSSTLYNISVYAI